MLVRWKPGPLAQADAEEKGRGASHVLTYAKIMTKAKLFVAIGD